MAESSELHVNSLLPHSTELNIKTLSGTEPNSSISIKNAIQYSSINQLSKPIKKENSLLSWFNLATPNNSSGGDSSSSITNIKQQKSLINPSNDWLAGSRTNTAGTSSTTESMQKNVKNNFDEIFHKESIDIVASTASNVIKQPEQPKISRRTSSLLNIFMYNSQGKMS